MRKYIAIFLIIIISFSTVFTASAGYTDWFVPTIHMPFRPADNYKTVQNPPGFTWPYIENAVYDLIVCSDKELTDIEYSAENLKANMYVFPTPFEKSREYYWAVKFRYENGYESPWSDARKFFVDGNASEFYINIPKDYSIFNDHPVFFSEEQIKNTDTSTEAFYSLYLSVEENIKNALPKVNPNDSESQKILYYQWAENVAEAALIYRITDRERYREFALKSFENLFGIRFEEFMAWNPNTDITETRFSYNAAIAFDLLYDDLSEKQKKAAIELIESTLKRPYENYQSNGKLNESMYEWPYSSHKYGMHMTMAAALIISGESDYAKEIVKFHLPFYSAYRDYCGIEDGSSFEGVFYALSPIDDEIEDFLIKYGITGRQAYNRNKAYDILYLWPDNWINMVGDGYRTKGGMCNAYLLKTFYYANNSKTDALKSVNKWIFNKESNAETYYSEKSLASVLYNDWKNVEAVAPKAFPSAKLFPDTGRAAMYSDMSDENRVGLIFVSNPYGSNGHAHPDQNSFVIQGYGEPLAVDSGFYEYYHSDFDLAWSRNSIAHNVITFDGGKGQPYGNIFANGKITAFLNHSDFDVVTGDAENAYFESDEDGKRTYMLKQTDREIIYLKPDTFICVDSLDSESERTYEWWLNTYGNMTYTDNTAYIDNNGAKLYADVLYPEVTSTHYDGFVDAEGKPLVNKSGEIIATPEGAKEFNDNRICFKTKPVKKTKMVTMMQIFEEEKKNALYETYNEYVKITTDGYTVYVNLTEGAEITADGYTFDGSSLVLKDKSVMLNEGKKLAYNGEVFVSSDNIVSVAYGNGEISISSLAEKSAVFINEEINSAYISKDEAIYPMSDFGKFGVNYAEKRFTVFPGEYHLYINGKLPDGHYTVEDNIIGNGTVKASLRETALYHDVIEYQIVPDEGWYIKEIRYNGETVEINSSDIFKTPPIEDNVCLDVEFAKITGEEELSVNTFNNVFEENGDTTVTIGEIMSKGLPVSEFGIIAGTENSDFRLSDADGIRIRKIPAQNIGKTGYFGVMIKDYSHTLGNEYYTRAYAVINGREYYGDVICAMKNGGYDENKDTGIKKATISGETINFDGNICFLNKCVAVNAVCNAYLNNENASCTIKRELYGAPGGKVGTVFKINVISEDGTKSEDYTVYCFDKSFIPPMEDADVRMKQDFPGNYPLLYVRKNDISSMLSFDISNVSEFETATLRLTEYQSTYCKNTISIYETKSLMWDENNISYFNAPEMGDLISTYVTDSSTNYETFEIDITEYVRKLKCEGKKVLNLTVTGTELSMLCSKENSNRDFKPIIIFK